MLKKPFVFLLLLFVLGAGTVFSQNVTLDNALKSSIAYLVEKLPKGTAVVVLNFTAKQETLSDYVIEELTANIVNSGHFTAVERRNLDAIQEEMNFQMSGEVSDESAQAIGEKLGAQIIISGSIDPLGDVYRLRIRSVEVSTAEIQGMQTFNVVRDAVLTALIGDAALGAAPKAGTAGSAAAPAPAAGKPVKKVPLRTGNFEVIDGKAVRAPIDTGKFLRAAVGALKELEYKIVQETPTVIVFRPEQKSIFGNWWVQIRLCFWNDEYWYEYVGSSNFNANVGRNTIDDDYFELLEDLESELASFYR